MKRYILEWFEWFGPLAVLGSLILFFYAALFAVPLCVLCGVLWAFGVIP